MNIFQPVAATEPTRPSDPEPVPDEGTNATTRDRLLDAAFAALEEKGLAGCRVSDIARRAGVTPGSIYVHFEDKAALITEALARNGTRGLPALSADLDGRGAAKALRETGQRLLSDEGSAFHRALLQMWATSLTDSADRQRIVHDLEKLRQRTAGAYGQMRGAGGVLSADALATFGMVLMLGTTVAKALGVPLLTEDDAATLVRELGDLAVRTRPRGSGSAAGHGETQEAAT